MVAKKPRSGFAKTQRTPCGACAPETVIARIGSDTYGVLGPQAVVHPEALMACARLPVQIEGMAHRLSVTCGYVQLQATGAAPWGPAAGSSVRGHEFHHSGLDNLPPGLRYAWHAETILAQLVRTAAYSAAGSALWALLPVIGQQRLGPFGAAVRFLARGAFTGLLQHVGGRADARLVAGAHTQFDQGAGQGRAQAHVLAFGVAGKGVLVRCAATGQHNSDQGDCSERLHGASFSVERQWRAAPDRCAGAAQVRTGVRLAPSRQVPAEAWLGARPRRRSGSEGRDRAGGNGDRLGRRGRRSRSFTRCLMRGFWRLEIFSGAPTEHTEHTEIAEKTKSFSSPP